MLNFFRRKYSLDAIEEILSESDLVWVIFRAEEEAEAALSLNGSYQDNSKKLIVRLERENNLPTNPKKRLTDELERRKNVIETKTVRFTGLQHGFTRDRTPHHSNKPMEANRCDNKQVTPYLLEDV